MAGFKIYCEVKDLGREIRRTWYQTFVCKEGIVDKQQRESTEDRHR